MIVSKIINAGKYKRPVEAVYKTVAIKTNKQKKEAEKNFKPQLDAISK